MSEDVFSDEDNESRYRMGEAVIAKGGGRKKPIIHDHMSGNVDEAEEYMEKLRKESDKYPDLDYSDKDPYEQLYRGKMEDLPMSVEKGVLSQLESVSSIDVPKKKTFDANIHELMSDMGEMDVNNMDINSFMKNPSLINNMLGEFSSEEKDEFSSLLTQFGMSGDIDAVVGDLFGTDDSKFKVSAPSAVPTSLATGGGDEMSEDEAKAMMELLQGGKPGVAPQSFPTTPDSADNVSEFNFDGNNDDREAFDELMQQLSRIETQTEGKVTLDNLMQQFMMEEGANMSDDSQEDQPLESMQTNRTDEFDFLQEDGNSPSDMSGGDRLASHRNDDAENDRGGHGFKKGRRLVPTLPMELVEFQPPATKSALGELDVASTAQKLASMLDDGGMNTQGKPSESSGDGELCLASRNNEGDLAPSESPAANDISSLIDIFSEGLTPDQKVVSTEAINFEWDRMEFGRVEEACDYASIDVLHRRLRNVEKSEIIFAHMIESGIEPTVDSVNALLANYTESLMSTGAVQIMEDMFARGNKYDLVPNSTTYQHLVRMYLRKKDMDNVLQTMDEMKALNINPTPETWGLVIDAYASRNKPVEALKVIEEVATSDPAVIKLIPDGYLKRIHALCRKLAVMHPSLPPDPEDWVRDVRVQRRRMKLASKSKIQPLRSYLYT